LRPYQLSLAESSVLPHQSKSGNECLDTKESPAEAGPSVRVFAEEGVLRLPQLEQFRAWGSGSFGENARHRSVATEQQIGRPARPYKKGTDENALYIAWK